MKPKGSRYPVRWRRSCSVVAYWVDRQFIIHDYRRATVVSADPIAARVLHHLADWRTLDALCRDLAEFAPASVRLSVRQLARCGLLLEEGSQAARDDAAFRRVWSSWLPHAGMLHFGTKDMPYTTSDEMTTQRLRAYLKEAPQPASFKSLSTKLSPKKLSLPEAASPDSDFFHTLMSRRTHREFSSLALDLDRLATLLRYTWGTTGVMRDSLLGDLPLKTSPSAGARHPCEVYVAALRVNGLPRGLYHYACDRHVLRPIPQPITARRAVQYCAGQDWVKDAAAVFLITAVFERSMWKYRFPRAYRTVLADAAHLTQTFCLVATYLQLAPFCTMALKDSLIERDLGIDGIKESALYVAGVGLPVSQV